MHARQLRRGWLLHEQIQALTLINETTPVASHVDENFLRQLPDRFEQVADILGYLGQTLDRAPVADNLILEFARPNAQLFQFLNQMFIDHHKLASQGPSQINIGRVRLDALVVAQNLRGGSRGHGRNQQAVSHRLAPKRLPLPQTAKLGRLPEVKLKLTPTHGRALKRLVSALLLGQFDALRHRPVIQRLENGNVHEGRLRAVKGQSAKQKDVSQALHANANGSVPRVGRASLFDRVKVSVDDPIQVASHDSNRLVQPLVIENAIDADETRKADGGQIADSHLIRIGILDDFRTVASDDAIEDSRVTLGLVETPRL